LNRFNLDSSSRLRQDILNRYKNLLVCSSKSMRGSELLTPGHVKLADVAKAAGVSQGTASNVFSRPEIVRDEVRERVLGVARKLGYNGPDIKGRLLRAGRVNAIGVAAVEPLSYFFDDPWARSLMTAIGAVCDASGTGIALVSANNEQRLAWNINSALVDGFILLCIDGGEKLVDLTRRRQLPFVALALGAPEISVPVIGIDNINGAAAAARHLAQMGHRRFAALTTGHSSGPVRAIAPDEIYASLGSTPRDRMLGYWQALTEFGVDVTTCRYIQRATTGRASILVLKRSLHRPVRRRQFWRCPIASLSLRSNGSWSEGSRCPEMCRSSASMAYPRRQ
jgi:DNA-binding LacI/PurR family transcriptional regulator